MTLIWIRKYWGNKNWWGCQRCIQGRVGGDGSFLYKWNAGLRGGLCLPQDCFFSWIYSMINNITSSKAHWKWGKNYNIVNHQTAWTHTPAWAVGVLFHHVMQFAATLARNSEPRVGSCWKRWIAYRHWLRFTFHITRTIPQWPPDVSVILKLTRTSLFTLCFYKSIKRIERETPISALEALETWLSCRRSNNTVFCHRHLGRKRGGQGLQQRLITSARQRMAVVSKTDTLEAGTDGGDQD